MRSEIVEYLHKKYSFSVRNKTAGVSLAFATFTVSSLSLAEIDHANGKRHLGRLVCRFG